MAGEFFKWPFVKRNAETANTSNKTAESAPKNIRVEKFSDCRTLKEVAEKNVAHAGRDMYEYIRNNPDSPQAEKLKDGYWHHFFGAAGGDGVPFLFWNPLRGRFIESVNGLDGGWVGFHRAVLLED